MDVTLQNNSPDLDINITERQATLMSIATFEHPNCIMCSSSSNMGLKLRFKVQPDGSVLAMFPCHDILQSYPKTLHGGMVSALLDAAMTNVLFSIGVVAVTAELTVKFHAPVNPDRFVAVSGTIDEKPVHPLYYVSAQIVQDNKVMAKATAKFIAKNAI